MKKLSTSLLLLAAIGLLCAAPSFAGTNVTFTSTPEPATLALMAAGLGAVAFVRKIRNKQ